MKKGIINRVAATLLLLAGGAPAQAADAVLPENLYLIGSATSAGWNCDAPLQMEKVNDYEFTYTGALTKGEFKFPWVVGGAMWSSETYMAMENGEKVGKSGLAASEVYLTHNGQPDSKWVVEDEGRYKLTLSIDRTDPAFGTLKAEYLGELPKAIYMLGNACGQWNAPDATPIYETDGKFVWTGDLLYYGEDKLFKFVLSRGDWDKVTFLVPTEVNHPAEGDKNVLQIDPGTYGWQESAETEPGALKDWFWGIKEGKSGKYEITVDLEAKTFTLKLLKSYAFDKDNTAELYMLGLGAESFDSNHPLPMTSKGNGKFSWTGDLDYATTDDNPNNVNKQFKFCTSRGDWNKVYYLVPAGADKDGFIQVAGPGTYPVAMTTWTDGKTGVDAFFGLEENKKGKYTVTVDVPQMTMTLAEGEGSAVTEIADGQAVVSVSGNAVVLAGKAAGVVYDMTGRTVAAVSEGTNDLSMLPAGVYIVRVGENSVKFIIR